MTSARRRCFLIKRLLLMAAKELFCQYLIIMQILPVNKNAAAGLFGKSREGGNNILPCIRFTETARAGVRRRGHFILDDSSVTMSARGSSLQQYRFQSGFADAVLKYHVVDRALPGTPMVLPLNCPRISSILSISGYLYSEPCRRPRSLRHGRPQCIQ